MDFFEFADKVARIAERMRAEDRNIVYAKTRNGMFVTDVEAIDDGSGMDNLDVVISLGFGSEEQ